MITFLWICTNQIYEYLQDFMVRKLFWLINLLHVIFGFLNYNRSLGGLGKDKSAACVSDIVVEKISLQNTLSGVRIKTWQVRFKAQILV